MVAFLTRHIGISFAIASLAVLATLATLGWTTRPQSYTPQGAGDVYLALGDSLAWGLRLDRPDQESYPALIHAELIADHAIELVNLAFPGETSGSFLNRQLPRALDRIAAAQAAGLRVSPITLNIGGNDLNARRDASDQELEAAVRAVETNLRRALDRLRDVAPDADIVVMTYYNPYGGDPQILGSEAYWAVRMNDAIRAAAAQHGVAVADGYGALDGGRAYTHTLILFGDIHANAQGHRELAKAFITALGYR
ncbi:MAG: SGNH/GDSL hydrolase family protein [Oscillochloris sp.]|nr:SGNH/GDSL hydrolase family protein [Oscillochloris sp.]